MFYEKSNKQTKSLYIGKVFIFRANFLSSFLPEVFSPCFFAPCYTFRLSFDENNHKSQVFVAWSVMIDVYTESLPPTPSGWK